MSQQINLFNPIFRKKGFSFTSAPALLGGVTMVFATLVVIAVIENQDLRGVEDRVKANDQQHVEAKAHFEKLTAELARQKPNLQLEAELALLDQQLKGRNEVVDALQSGVVGNTSGFSEYMRAFSRQSVNGLWLTGFDIALAGSELAIQGRTLSADLVADYLARLNREKALQGRQFAAMRISQPLLATSGKTGIESGQLIAPEAKSGKDPKELNAQKAEGRRYLEFSISTREIPERVGSVDVVAQGQGSLLGKIEPSAIVESGKSSSKQGDKQ